jgi:hypothetical protein
MRQSEWLSQFRQLYNEHNGTELTLDDLLAIPPAELLKPRKYKPSKRSRAERYKAANVTRRANRMDRQSDAIALVKEYRSITSIDGLVVMLKERKLTTHQGKPFNRERVQSLLQDIDGER